MCKSTDQGVNPGCTDLSHGVTGISDRPPHARRRQIWSWIPTRQVNGPRNGELVDQRLRTSQERVSTSEGLPDSVGETFGFGALGVRGESGFKRFRVERGLFLAKSRGRGKHRCSGHYDNKFHGFPPVGALLALRKWIASPLMGRFRMRSQEP
jgi:hypothetical protein